MKSELGISNTFPALYKRVNKELVVLFTSVNRGTVVYSRKTIHRIGEHSNDWFDCTNESDWQRLPNGTTITLTQE